MCSKKHVYIINMRLISWIPDPVGLGQGWQIHSTRARGGTLKDFESTQTFLLSYIIYYIIFWVIGKNI